MTLTPESEIGRPTNIPSPKLDERNKKKTVKQKKTRRDRKR